MRLALALSCALAVAVGAASDGRAARECAGLEVCIPVAGPWVAVPAPSGRDRVASVLYQLSCPKGSIAGGVDAVVSERTVDVAFLGALGSPVGPGVTTGRHVLFVGTYAGAARRSTTFRPFLGCVPTSGGGDDDTVFFAAFRPGLPPVRRVRTLRLRGHGARALTIGCGRGERLVGSSHAVAFRRRAQPFQSWLGAVAIVRRERGGRVTVTARIRAPLPASSRPEVQVHALCTARRP